MGKELELTTLPLQKRKKEEKRNITKPIKLNQMFKKASLARDDLLACFI